MSRHEHYDDYDPMEPPSASFLRPTPPAPRNLPREPKLQRSGRRHRHERTSSQPVQPIYGVPGPSHAAQGAAELAPPTLSPPRPGPSPVTEPGLLPGGGVEIRPGFRFDEADRGHYRTRTRDLEDGEWEQPHVLGGFGFGILKSLKSIPRAIVKAGRSYGPRSEVKEEMGHLSDAEPEHVEHQFPTRSDVEMYQEYEEEEDPIPEEQRLRDFVQRRRRRRDRAQQRRGREHPQYIPAPQPIPVPGSRATSAVPSQVGLSRTGHSQTGHSQAGHSQVGHSQAGHSDIPPQTLEAQLEAVALEREREALEQAQARERARHVYASEAVKQPSSTTFSDPRSTDSEPLPSRRRTNPEHRLSNHVFSRWTAERDAAGRRKENHHVDETLTSASTSPLTPSGFVRLLRQIRDMPWVGDRVAADYIPGGVRPERSSSRYTSYTITSSPRSDSTFTSLSPRALNIPPDMRAKAGQSWYTMRDDVIVLPEGVEPPPGFIPYPYQYQEDGPHSRTASGTSHTHIEAPAPTYANGNAYHYMPAAASPTGQPYYFVPMRDGRHQPLVVPAAGR